MSFGHKSCYRPSLFAAQTLPTAPKTGDVAEFQLAPWKIDYHILLFVDDNDCVVSGICCEVYCFSATALVTYLVTSPACRKQGHASQLTRAMVALLASPECNSLLT
jgi:ribosomal protein S18 acetylase RimI-like enzyme